MAERPLSPLERVLSESPSMGLPSFQPTERRPSAGAASPTELMPVFEDTARKYDVPVNVLLALGEQESSFNPRAVGQQTKWGTAKGLMQYLDSTAQGMGINPYDPVQSIDAAARQIRERLDKGYSMEDAVKEHFAGPDRRQWGAKTARYGQEVLQKAGRWAEQFQARQPAAQPDLQAQLDAEEPGRYKVLTPKEAESYQRRADLMNGGNPAELTAIPKAQQPSPLIPGTQTPQQAPSPLTIENQRRVEAGAQPKDTRPYQSFTEATGAALSNVPERFQQSIAGLFQMAGEDMGQFRERDIARGAAARGITPGDMKLLAWAGNNGLVDPKTDYREALSYIKQNIAQSLNEQQLKELDAAGIINPAEISAFARDWREQTQKTMAEVRPEPESMAYYGSAAIGSLAEMGPMLAAAIVTRNPKIATAVMGGQVGGQAYATGREKGLSEDEAQNYALLTAAAEAAPEALVLGKLLKPGAGIMKKALEGTVLEGAQEAVTAALQAGIDKGYISQDMTLREALVQVRDGAIIGAMVGGGMGGAIGTAERVSRPSERQQVEREINQSINNWDGDLASVPSATPAAEPSQATPQAEAAPAQAAPVEAAPVQQPAPQPAPSGPLGRAMQNAMPGRSEESAADGPRITLSAEGLEPISGAVIRETPESLMIRGDDGQSYEVTREEIASGAAVVRPEGADVVDPQQIRPEPKADTQAQIDALSDPTSGKDAALVTLNSEQPPTIPEGLTAIETSQGLFITNNPEKAAAVEQRGGKLSTDEIGALLDYTTPKSQTDGTVVQARDAAGNVVTEEATNQQNLAQAVANAENQAPEGGSVNVTNGDAVLQERAARVEQERKTYDQMDEAELRERLKYLGGQARNSGGWNKALMQERRKVEQAIEALTKPTDQMAVKDEAPAEPEQKAEQPTPDQAPVKWFGSREKADAFIAKKKMAGTHEVVEAGRSRFEIREKAQQQKTNEQSAASLPTNRTQAAEAGAAAFAAGDTRVPPAMKPGLQEAWLKAWDKANVAAPVKADPKADMARAMAMTEDQYIAAVNPTGERISSEDRVILKAGDIDLPAGSQQISTFRDNKGRNVRVLRADDGSMYAKSGETVLGFVGPFEDGKTVVDVIESEQGNGVGRGLMTAYIRENPMAQSGGFSEAGERTRRAVFRALKAEQQGAAPSVAETQTETPKAEQSAKPSIVENKIFTEDAAEKARALLKSKLTQLNSGIDPVIMQAGITLAGYHIEKGARTFAAYAKAMVGDLGDVVRPYLKSWYLGVRFDPRAAGFDGMNSAAEVEAFDLAQLEETPNEPQQLDQPGQGALERAPAEPVQGAQGQEPARQRAEAGGRADARRNERTGSQRDDDARGLGSDEGAVPVPAAGDARGGRGGERGAVQRGDGSDAAGRAGSVTPSNGVTAEQRAANYTITDADQIGSGGAKTKYKNNLAAIRLLKQLEKEGRPATRDEQSVLAKYVGWGGLPQAFERSDSSASKGWEKEVAELKGLLTAEEYSAAASSSKNAHYTAPEIVRVMWDAVTRLGFNGGKVLEPSVGTGNFFGLMPHELRKSSALNGVELDRITSGIAAQLYPEAKIARMGYQDYLIPDGYFDLAIGNPPFGRESLYDGKRKDLNGFSIHNYFFAKSLDGLRPGGVLAMVVTNRMLDVPGDKARRYMADRADFIGAIRLPNDAFMANAGTSVTTDIIFMRKRAEGEKPAGESWMEVRDYADKDGNTVPLNEYFVRNPDMMLGDFGAYGSMYREGEPALVAREGQSLPDEIARAVARLPRDVMTASKVAKPETRATVRAESVRVGSMFLDGDTVRVRGEDVLGENTAEAVTFPNDKARDRVVGMIGIRDALARVRGMQLDSKATDKQIEAARKTLNQAYDSFVKDNGPINLDANKRLFRDDPTWPQLAALEDSFDKGVSAAVAKKTGEEPRKPSAQKAAIFSKRTQQPYQAPTTAASANDALVASLAETGRVDLQLMSDLYGKSPETIVKELGELVYQDQVKGYVTRDEYLSGNVKAKLAQAKAAAQQDAAYARNVEALEAVQPADIEAVDINVKPGAPWVPAAVMGEFANHIAEGSRSRAVYNPASAKWSFLNVDASPAASQRFATSRVALAGVLEAAANQKVLQVYDQHTDGTRTLNESETQLANDKVNAVKDEWGRWIWADDARRESLSRLYNDTYNTNVSREYDGAHLTFPGKVGDDIINLRPHQANAVWRIVQNDTTLLDHVVGAGKTFTMVAGAMELRRMGYAKKPMFVVPNHLVSQWAADFTKLYPGANVLAATKKDFEKENRKRLFARISTGDWDAVIVAHSSFGKVEVEPKEQAAFIEEQIADLDGSIELMRQTDGKDSRNVKDTQKRRDALREKLKKLLDADNKDDSLYWGELGVDALFVDEAHEFKNLAFSTSMNRVAGLGTQTGSQKAADLFLKVRQVLNATGGRNIVFATGTPISNTMAEMFTMQRYLDYSSLKGQGLSHFDAWARMFGEVVTDWELSPSGKYKMNSRFAKFVNMPELMQRYGSFADVVNRSDINRMLAAQGKKLPVPKVRGGKPENVIVPRSQDQANYIGEPIKDEDGNETDQYPRGSLVWRSENLPKKAEKGADNMLKIMGDARKAALDMRLIDPSYPDNPNSKVNVAADRMADLYQRWSAERGTQLVFIDLSTPKNAKAAEAERLRDLVRRAEEGDEAASAELDKVSPDELMALDGDFSVYDDLKQKLIDRGVPAEEIAFIHDAKTDLQKDELFGKVRSGRVRFLFGSTAKMGAGTNVQDRLVALHHLDAPWRPSDLEQREGRIIRQGNKLYDQDPEGFEVGIYRYATKQTLDSRMWQTIEGKANFIEQVRKGAAGTREVEDVAGEAANAAEMKAAASGNPLILEEMSLRQKIRKLENERSNHDREQFRLRDSIRMAQRRIESADRLLADLREDAKREVPKDFAMTINGSAFDKRKDAGEAILAQAASMEANGVQEAEVGQYGGFTLRLERLSKERFEATLNGAGSYDIAFELGSDPLGLTMRITNTVKDLGGAVEQVERDRAKAEKDIPRLEEQSADWSKGDELAQTRERYSRVIDELKPKKKEKAEEVKASLSGDTAVVDGERMSIAEPASAERVREVLTAGPLGKHLAKMIDARRLVIHEDSGTVPGVGLPGMQAKTTEDGVVHMVANNVTEQNAQAVLLHEMFHSGARPLVGTRKWARLLVRLESLYKQYERSNGNARDFFNAARRRVDSANAQMTAAGQPMSDLLTAEEFGAYAIEAYESAPGAVRRWVDDVVGAIKDYLFRTFGIQLGNVTPPQLRAMAVAAVRNQVVSGQSRQETFSLQDQPNNTPSDAEIDGWFSRKLTDAMAGPKSQGRWSILSTAPLDRMVEELAGDNQPAQEYLNLKRDMDAYRSQKHQAFDDIAQNWLKLNVTNRQAAADMAALMHEATIAQVDPAEPFKSSITKADEQVMAYQPNSEAGEAAFAKKAADEKRREDHKRLAVQFRALPSELQALYRQVRDSYKEMSAELDDILAANLGMALDIAGRQAERRYTKEMEQIRDDGLTGEERKEAEAQALKKYNTAMSKQRWNKRARMTELRQQLESNRLEGPYFPLARFGDYFVTVRDRETGEVISFSRFESATEQQRFAKQAQRDGNVQTGLLSNDSDVRGSVDPRFVTDVENILSGAEVPDAVKDQVWQRYLESMPDMSVRKGFIHRKNRAGYSADALRAFASRMFHGAHQLGRLKYGAQMQEQLDLARDVARDSANPERNGAVINELNRRNEFVMNPKGGALAQHITSAAFVYQLSMSPAAALVNLTQTAIVGVPVIGAKFGVANTVVELNRALGHFVSGRGRAENSSRLTDDEKAAMRAAYAAGIVDSSQAHNLAGVGETGVQYSALRNRVMGVIAWMFHQAERLNREVTFLAAYRLAKKDGASHEQAIDQAGRLTYKVHFDYQASNRPRVMQGDVAKVALVFRNFQVNMLWRLFRDTHQAFAGDKAARKEAVMQLAGITGMMAMSAGVRGVWLYGLAMAFASMLFGDDAEEQFKKGTIELLGPTAAGFLLNGIPGHGLTYLGAGISLSERIGMPDLWFRSPDRQLEGQNEFNYWQSQILGAVPGIMSNMWRGWNMVLDGKVYRGVETMAPKFVRDLMRAGRFADEGVQTLRGDPLVEDLKPGEIAAQMLGFTPAVVAEQYERNSALKNAEKRIMDERRRLMDRYATAYKLKDEAQKMAVRKEMKAFNEKNREVAITSDAITRSIMSRRRFSERTDGGVALNPRLDRRLRDSIGDAIYR